MVKVRYLYTLYTPARQTFTRNRVEVVGIDEQWQADHDVPNLKQHNGGCRYLLTCIDTFSKYAWVVPVKQKTASVIIAAFKRIFLERKLSQITDRSRHQKSHSCKNQQCSVFHHPKSNYHCGKVQSNAKNKDVEIFYRPKYVDTLEKFLQNYISSYHWSIRMAPVNVGLCNKMTVYKNLRQ